MMKNNFLRAAVLGTVAMLSSVGSASAGTITLTGLGFYQYPVPMLISNGTVLENAVAGQINIVLDGQSLIAYCVDLFTNIGLSTYNSTSGDPSGYTNGTRAAWILDTYKAGVTNNEAGAALQLALWDVVHDGGDGLSNGNVRLDPTGSASLRTAAEAIVTASAGHASNNATILHNSSSDGTPRQTLITDRILQVSSIVDTPEPGSLLMAAAGLCLFGFRRRPC